MSDEPNGQPLMPQLPPAQAVEEEEEEPVVDPDNDDGYEADDEGDDGWPQDPFEDDDNMSIITDEGEGEDNGEEPVNNLDQDNNN